MEIKINKIGIVTYDYSLSKNIEIIHLVGVIQFGKFFLPYRWFSFDPRYKEKVASIFKNDSNYGKPVKFFMKISLFLNGRFSLKSKSKTLTKFRERFYRRVYDDGRGGVNWELKRHTNGNKNT